VDPHLIAMLKCRPSSKGVDVLATASQRGDWSGDSALREAVNTFVRDQQLAGESLYTVLPRHEITTRILELPSTESSEITQMLDLSAEDYVPFARHELIIDHCILNKAADGNSRVLAAFARRDGVESHVETLRMAGVEPQGILLSTACLASAAIAAQKSEASTFALINLGASGIEVLVVGSRGLEYGRAAATVQEWGLAEGSEADAVEEFTVEVRASLAAHRRESDDGIGAEIAYVCSDWADVKPICDTVAHELTTPCEPTDIVQGLVANEGAVEGHVSSVLLGGALIVQDRGAVKVSLVPDSLKHERAQKTVKRRFAQTAILVASITILLGALFAQAVWQRTAYIKDLQGRVAAIEPRSKSTMSKQRQFRILRQQVDQSHMAMALLSAIVEQVPNGVNITSFDYVMDSRITIKGRAISDTLPLDFAVRIRTAQKDFPVLAGAQSSIDNRTSEYKKPVVVYTITIPFPKEEGAAPTQGAIAI
jgi:hypothetical protein